MLKTNSKGNLTENDNKHYDKKIKVNNYLIN